MHRPFLTFRPDSAKNHAATRSIEERFANFEQGLRKGPVRTLILIARLLVSIAGVNTLTLHTHSDSTPTFGRRKVPFKGLQLNEGVYYGST